MTSGRPERPKRIECALEYIQNASAYINSEVPDSWRRHVAVLLSRLALAIEHPGQYEFVLYAKEAENALMIEAELQRRRSISQ